MEDNLILDRSGSQIVRCTIKLAEDQLAKGRYILTAEWSAKADRQRFRDPVGTGPRSEPAMIEFEMRAVVSAADQLDFDIHFAQRALQDRQKPDAALELIDRVLSKNSFSTSELILRAKIRGAHGACQGAAADWRRAATVMSDRSDITNKQIEALSEDERRTIAAKWEEKAKEQTCR